MRSATGKPETGDCRGNGATRGRELGRQSKPARNDRSVLLPQTTRPIDWRTQLRRILIDDETPHHLDRITALGRLEK